MVFRRFDAVIKIPNPSSEDRAQIIKHRLSSSLCTENFDARSASDLFGMEGLSCAEVRALCNSAALAALGAEGNVALSSMQAALQEFLHHKLMVRGGL